MASPIDLKGLKRNIYDSKSLQFQKKGHSISRIFASIDQEVL